MDGSVGDNAVKVIWERALRFIGIRPRSENEMKMWMERKGIVGDAANELFNRLKSVSLIDDREFVRWWVDQRVSFRPRGKIMIWRELRNKGVAEHLIKELFAEIPFDELANALVIARKKLGRLGVIESRRTKERLMSALLRRGFSWEVTRRVIDGLSKKG